MHLFNIMGIVKSVLVLLLIVFGAAPAIAADRLIIVLDASGSMWGRIDGKSKVEIARETLADVIQQLDSELEVGLVAYGHRRKDDCGDIETIVPAGPLDRKKLVASINKLPAKGKTPLTAAVRKAAEELNYTEERATVVLISDGVENCGLDPCAIGADLETAGVDFTAHVIGFDVSKPKDRAQLQCLADNTGGRFISANNAGELVSALETIAVAPEQTPIEPISLEAPEQVAPGEKFEVALAGTVVRDGYVDLARPEQPGGSYVSQDSVYPGERASLTAPDAPGDYELRFHYFAKSDVIATRTIRVRSDISLEAPEQVAPGEKFEVALAGTVVRDGYVDLARPEQPGGSYVSQDSVYPGERASLTAPDAPGDYELRFRYFAKNDVIAVRPITVKEDTRGELVPPTDTNNSSTQARNDNVDPASRSENHSSGRAAPSEYSHETGMIVVDFANDSRIPDWRMKAYFVEMGSIADTFILRDLHAKWPLTIVVDVHADSASRECLKLDILKSPQSSPLLANHSDSNGQLILRVRYQGTLGVRAHSQHLPCLYSILFAYDTEPSPTELTGVQRVHELRCSNTDGCFK